MVKVYGPALSLDASGTIGDAMTFSKWKGRNYVRERVIPSNPRSGLQVGFRSMFKFLSQQWDGLAAPDKASYAELAAQINASPFNAYMRANQLRWRNFSAPSQAYPPAMAGAIGVFAGGFPTAIAGVASVQLAFSLATVNQNWAVAVFQALAPGFTTSLANCIAVVELASVAMEIFLHSPLEPDTYYYNFRLITEDGILGAEEGEINATVTA